MKNWVLTGLMSLAIIGLASDFDVTQAKDGASIDEIMKKAYNKGKGLLGQLNKDLTAKETPWEGMKKKSEDLVKYISANEANKPPKGEASSWAKLTKKATEEAKKVSAAVEKKDLEAAKAAHKYLMNSCKECHDAHKEE
jgi:hypothetical protein